jgi:hypothetical protein
MKNNGDAMISDPILNSTHSGGDGSKAPMTPKPRIISPPPAPAATCCRSWLWRRRYLGVAIK